MPQHDQVIDNGPGLSVRTDINAALAALFSTSQGDSEPTVRVAGQLWFDSFNNALKIRDKTNASWLDVATNITGSFLPVTGGTLTGSLSLDPTVGSAQLTLDKVAGNSATVRGQVAGAARWDLQLGNGDTEAGSNTGSAFEVKRYNDAGVAIDSPLTINRGTGLITANLAMPTVHAHRSGAGSVALGTATWTKVNLGTIATSSNVGGWSISGSSLVVPKNGVYLVGASVSIATPVSICSILAGFGFNGTLSPAFQARAQQQVAAGGTWILNTQRPASLVAGDKIELLAFCSVAGATAQDSIDSTGLWATMIAAQ